MTLRDAENAGDNPDMLSHPSATLQDGELKTRINWRAMLGGRRNRSGEPSSGTSISDLEQGTQKRPERWTMGILNDSETDEVPGSILLLSKVSEYNEPLGLRNAPARTSASSLPSCYPPSISSSTARRRSSVPEKKRTADGKIVLEPQPDDTPNDPLNWAAWRRDLSLLSLGFYCMVGGGMTPILAAGFNDVAADYGVSVPQVALTTGLYMMGLGIGSVILSPTAILFGKRPVYLVAAICFILTSVWCALSPNFSSLVIARIFMGVAVSSVECLPSASVAEIFFLHEKAYRLGIYTLLLLGGKNLVPLVSAVIIESLGWRWVFWIVAMVVGFGLCLLFLFVPETFWDRTPVPNRHGRGLHRNLSIFRSHSRNPSSATALKNASDRPGAPGKLEEGRVVGEKVQERHARFDVADRDGIAPVEKVGVSAEQSRVHSATGTVTLDEPVTTSDKIHDPNSTDTVLAGDQVICSESLGEPNSPSLTLEAARSLSTASRDPQITGYDKPPGTSPNAYTNHFQSQPPKTFSQQLRPWSGRLRRDNWFRVAFRPFILFCYPSILWSTLVYSLSIGWLIVLSESVSTIYKSRDTYNFTSLQAGLVYISPFVGGILGTAVAGRLSDVIVRALARRNGGVYEPEFRLVMGLPIAIFTTLGLMGYGWSAQEHDRWIVPTVFFGFISFGCSLGSTTSITFAVDSYRQYAGEALVTLNFSKNVFHGLVFSLFFNKWLDADGSKRTFVAIGAIQMGCLLTTIPMYIYGKRARMWTVRKNFMEKF